MDDEVEQREEQLSGAFCEEEDLINRIRQSKHYRADSVPYQFGRVFRRSETTTDLSTGSTGDGQMEFVHPLGKMLYLASELHAGFWISNSFEMSSITAFRISNQIEKPTRFFFRPIGGRAS